MEYFGFASVYNQKLNISEITNEPQDRGFSAEKASEVSKWFERAVEGGRLTKKETAALKYSEDIGEAFRDLVLNENSVVNQRTSDYSNLMQNPSLVTNSVVDTADTDGYNNGRGEDNAISDGGRNLSGDTSSEGTHPGTAGEGKTAWREDEESFLRRAQSDSDETGRGRRTLLKSGDTQPNC